MKHKNTVIIIVEGGLIANVIVPQNVLTGQINVIVIDYDNYEGEESNGVVYEFTTDKWNGDLSKIISGVRLSEAEKFAKKELKEVFKEIKFNNGTLDVSEYYKD